MQSNIGGNNTGQANKATIWFIVGFIVLVTAGRSSRACIRAEHHLLRTQTRPVAHSWRRSRRQSRQPTGAKATRTRRSRSWSTVILSVRRAANIIRSCNSLCRTIAARCSLYFATSALYIHPSRNWRAGGGSSWLEGGVAKYWAMNDLLYTKQNEWSVNSALTPQQVLSQYFDGYAQSIGLDVNTFNSDINATSCSKDPGRCE